MKFFNKLFNKIKINSQVLRVLKHNKKKWSSWRQKNTNAKILCDFTDIGEATIAFSYFLNVLANKKKAKIIPFISRPKDLNLAFYLLYKSFNADGLLICLRLNKEQKKISNQKQDQKLFYKIKLVYIYVVFLLKYPTLFRCIIY